MSKEQEIEQLRSLRGIPKGLVTKMATWVAQHGENATVYDLDVKLEQLKKYEAQFEKVQAELELKDPTEREPDATERETFDDRVMSLKAGLMGLRALHQETNAHETTFNNISVDVSGSELPKYDMPKFDGDYKAYPQFKEAFDKLVHQSKAKNLTDVKRFAILKSALTGKALEAVEEIPIGSEGYKEALDALEERFGNKRLIFEAYVRRLWEHQKATDTTSLRKLCDSVSAVLRGLKILGTDADITSSILTHLILTKCDKATVKEWEESIAKKKDLIGKEEFLDYLKTRCTQLESVEYALESHTGKTSTPTQSSSNRRSHVNATSSSYVTCPACNGPHALIECNIFLEKPTRERYLLARSRDRCLKCLLARRGHRCSFRCDVCHKNHNTLLHFDTTDSPQATNNTLTPEGTVTRPIENTLTLATTTNDSKMPCSLIQDMKNYTFLATALVLVQSVDGNDILLRLLLDGGSQTHLITERAAKLLGLPQHRLTSPLEVRGVNSSVSLTHAVTAQIKSLHHDMNESVTMIVHRKLHQKHPAQPFDIDAWKVPNELPLADKKFNIPQDVDIILNANQTYKYLLPGQISLGPDKPILQNTLLGWIVVGDLKNINDYDNDTFFSCTNTLTDSLSDPLSLAAIMQKFWEVESIHGSKILSSMETEYERQFKSSYSRLSTGKFVVRLPFVHPPSLLGASRNIATRRLFAIKKKMDADPDYKQQYTEFMEEYISLGHCTLMQSIPKDRPHCYIPHFAVHNLDSTTTKTRVVFDASAKTDNGTSLNDLLMVGPTIQRDLVAHLLTFRSHPVAITGDLSKMYRNIDVAPEDRLLQLILWFDGDKVNTYCLNTVTYGTASAPFVAIRCLHELADTDGNDVPLGANTLKNNFYVDDWLGGANSSTEAIKLHEQLQVLLKRGQLTLRKIQSNSPKVMQSIPDDLKGKFVTIGDKDVIKTLGMNWLPNSDVFVYHYEPGKRETATKRSVLSETGRLFDPLGLLQPVIVKAKIFMQQLWANDKGWDEPLDAADNAAWTRFAKELQQVEHIEVPRFVCQSASDGLELHGFCDASEKAYCACIYVRTCNANDTSNSRLLIAKTRVAPLKTVTLPRLELLGAVLLAELYDKVRQEFPRPISRSFLWSDSTITLKWITGSPHKWLPVVGTRVTKIQTLTTNAIWRHVPSQMNPADIGSRGLWPAEILECTQWFNGPTFLAEDENQWPSNPNLPDEVPDTRNFTTIMLTEVYNDEVVLCKYTKIAPLFRFLAWPKIRRVFGYVHRFIHRINTKWRTINNISTTSEQIMDLSVAEINNGVITIARIIQNKYFHAEIKAISTGHVVSSASKLSTLGPVLDEDRVIRVGGRIKNAPHLQYNEKFPIVLPAEHPITEMIVIWTHFHNLHAPQSELLAFVRQQFWPISGKTLVNRVVRNCYRCSRLKPVPLMQIMADLPPDRVSEAKRAFLVTAIDFAGPFVVHYKGRGSRTTKVYLAVYVCFSSKAIHLDVVENLSTDAFLDSLRRFVGRRGVPAKLYTDNATNFVGARNKLNDLWVEVSKNNVHIQNWCRDTYGIDWKFMPPRTPHFGGLHEAAVKCFKQHFTKVIGASTLTLWEMMTVVTMIEGILNSRPLVPLSLCPQDNEPLTPGHLLIGGPLNALPDPVCDDGTDDTLYQWSKTIVARQLFWRRWSKEYLQSLQQRYKWAEKKYNVTINDLVLLIEKNTPSVTWAVGRVVEVFPGKDGHVRVINVKTKNGISERGITEVCLVPKHRNMD